MSHATIPKPTQAIICDLCGEEIPEETYQGGHDHRGTVTRGWIGHPVTSRTKHAWLMWPPGSWKRTKSWEEMQKPENSDRTYDFHGECIVALVEANLHTGVTPTESNPTPKENR